MTNSDSNARKVEEYIRNLEWSEGTPDIQKTLVAGNIRAFYFWSQTHLTPRVLDGLYCQFCGELLADHLVTENGGHCQPARQ